MEESLRSRAAKAKRAARLTNEGPSETGPSKDKPTVTVRNLHFSLDEDAKRQVAEEQAKVRDILGLKDA